MQICDYDLLHASMRITHEHGHLERYMIYTHGMIGSLPIHSGTVFHSSVSFTCSCGKAIRQMSDNDNDCQMPNDYKFLSENDSGLLKRIRLEGSELEHGRYYDFTNHCITLGIS